MDNNTAVVLIFAVFIIGQAIRSVWGKKDRRP